MSNSARPGAPGWVIGRVAGAPIILTRSWILAAVVLTLIFAPTVEAAAPQLGAARYIVAFGFAVLLFGSVLVHELAHGLMARARGQHVEEFALTVWGGHTTFSGVAPTPATSALVAVVGPVANLVLAVLFWLGAQAGPSTGLLALLLYAGAISNGFVGLFNLVPGLPLDGGQILQAAVWQVTGDRHKGSVAAGWAGRVVAIGVLVWALATPLAQGRPVDLFTVVWAALIGAFLWNGASAAITAGRTNRNLESLTVESVGRRATSVPVQATLADVDRARGQAQADEVVILSPDGRPAAYVDQAAAAAVPPEHRAVTPVSAVAVVIPVGAVVDARLRGADLVRAVGHVTRTSGVVAAVQDGHVTAIVRAADVIAALRS